MGADQFAETLRNWRGLYKAAYSRPMRANYSLRIEEARRALVSRSRELFATSPNYDGEVEAVEDALYALHALESCMKSHTKDRRHTP